MKITGKTLINRGWKPGPHFKQALIEAQHLFDIHGGSDEELLVLIDHLNVKEKEYPKLRDPINAPSIKTAFSPITENDEADNFIKCVLLMDEMARCPVVTDLALMPDACPAGPGITVGGVIAAKNAIIPAAHSADLCCSMRATFFRKDFLPPEMTVTKMMDILMGSTRFGPGGYLPHGRWLGESILNYFPNENPFLKGLEFIAETHLGNQGDGNHFAYLGEYVSSRSSDLELEDGVEHYVLVTHHGSKGLGANVYRRGLDAAVKQSGPHIPKHMAWIDTNTGEGKEYIKALEYIQRWTYTNHDVIHKAFLNNIQGAYEDSIYNAHNFVWPSEKNPEICLHGKGATPVGKGATGLIPLNMAEPILIVRGHGNDYLDFAPHGAGRNISRTELKKKFSTQEEMDQMLADLTKGLDIRWYCGKPDISESPFGYKNAADIIKQIEEFDLCEIIGQINPLGCIMAGEIEQKWEKKKKT